MSPPALGLYLHKTCRTVVYGKPVWFDYCLASVFYRQFFWFECALFPEDLPKGSVLPAPVALRTEPARSVEETTSPRDTDRVWKRSHRKSGYLVLYVFECLTFFADRAEKELSS